MVDMMDMPDANTPHVVLRDVHKRYGGREVLRGLSLRVRRGEKVVLIGQSGSGKSTVLRLLMGLDAPEQGTIEIDGVSMWTTPFGKPASDAHLRSVRKKLGIVFQHFNLFPHLSALGNVTLAVEHVAKKPRAEAERIAREWLAQVGLGDRANAHPAQLSGGQKQRVAIARALAMEPEVMLFDEVTSGLDPELVGEVLKVLHTLARSDRTMLLVTHQMDFAQRIADRLVMIDEGRVLEEGSPEGLLRSPKHERTQRFLCSTTTL